MSPRRSGTPFLVLLTSLLLATQLCAALQATVLPGQADCYYEILKQGEHVDIYFEVGEGGNHDIDFLVRSPRGELIAQQKGVGISEYTIQAKEDGPHMYCFSNEMSSVTEKKVWWNVHGLAEQIHFENVDDTTLEREILELADNLKGVQEDLAYFKRREAAHRRTAESTNDRVKWWSLFQFVILVTVCFWQVYYLKRFFEVKRTV